MINNTTKLELQSNPTDLKDLISYQMFKIISSKIHATYDARAVLKDLNKMVAIDHDDMLDFLIKNTPADKVSAKKQLRNNGFTKPFAIQVEAVWLYDIQNISKKESIFQQMVNYTKK